MQVGQENQSGLQVSFQEEEDVSQVSVGRQDPRGHWVSPRNVQQLIHALREGLKRKYDFYLHFVDKGFTPPPPLSTSADFIIIL